VSAAVADVTKYKTGFFYTDEFRDSKGSSWNGYEHNVLMKNLGDGKFVDVGMALGADSIDDARGVAVADFDADGDLDIVLNHNPGVKPEFSEGIAPRLLRNDIPIAKDGSSPAGRNWLTVDLTGGAIEDPAMANPDAIGAEVRVTFSDGTKMLRHVVAGSSYASQRTKKLHFGLGSHTEVEKLVVRWMRPAGAETVMESIPANQVLCIDQFVSENTPSVAGDLGTENSSSTQ
jgi:hypothetical protein